MVDTGDSIVKQLLVCLGEWNKFTSDETQNGKEVLKKCIIKIVCQFVRTAKWLYKQKTRNEIRDETIQDRAVLPVLVDVWSQ